MSNRNVLYVLMALVPLSWGGLLAFTRSVPPHSLAAYLTFFVLLLMALTCSLSLIAYGLSRGMLASRLLHPSLRQALREGFLISAATVLNLVLRSLHSWNIFAGVVTVVVVVIIEIFSFTRK